VVAPLNLETVRSDALGPEVSRRELRRGCLVVKETANFQRRPDVVIAASSGRPDEQQRSIRRDRAGADREAVWTGAQRFGGGGGWRGEQRTVGIVEARAGAVDDKKQR